jgi:hypothetical protein
MSSLEAPMTWLGVPLTGLGAPMTSLEAPRITVGQSESKNIFFGDPAGAAGNHGYNLLFNDI